MSVAPAPPARSYAWLVACTVLGLGAALLWGIAGPAPMGSGGWQPWGWNTLDWRARPWTLWTSAWVYESGGYLAAHLLALALLALVGTRLGAAAPEAIALLCAWPLAVVALLAWPDVTHYGGLAAPLHAAALILWAFLGVQARALPLRAAVLAACAFKLGAEHAWTRAVGFEPMWATNLNYAANVTGALSGAVCGLLCAKLAQGKRAAGS